MTASCVVDGDALLLLGLRRVTAWADTRNSTATIATIRQNSHAASLYPGRW